MNQETNVGGWIVRLHERDQYNDYSVRFDYVLEVIEPGHHFGRQWHLGTDKNVARTAYTKAIRLTQEHVR